MGILRGAFISLVAVVLFLSVFLMNGFLNLTWSLEYDTLEPNLVEYAGGLINETGVREAIVTTMPAMEAYCFSHNNYILTEGDFNFEIPCTVVDSGPDNIINFGIETLIFEIYYDDYNCEFWECVKTSDIPFVLISKKAHDYWNENFRLTLWIALIAFAIMFLFSKDKGWILMLGGIFTLLSSYLFKKFDWFLSILPDMPYLDVINVFFSRANAIFIIMMFVGGALLITGIAFKFFKISFNVFKLFRKKGKGKKEGLTKEDVQDAVREELSKKDQKKIKKKEKKKRKRVKRAEKGYKDLTKK